MPTGYTLDLYDGKDLTFEEFALKCARAFGALISMRDKLIDAPIPEKFEPSDYHLKELEKAKKRLEEIKGWDEEKAEQEAERAYKEALKKREETIKKNELIRKRYEDMLLEVQKWKPPTPDHEGLKKFMIQQLEESIEFDCFIPEMPQYLSGEEFREQQIKKALNDIEYHGKEYVEEVNRVYEKNKWLFLLRESLKKPIKQ